MQIFNNDTFHDFIGDASLIEPREWGHEWRFSVSKQVLRYLAIFFEPQSITIIVLLLYMMILQNWGLRHQRKRSGIEIQVILDITIQEWAT